MSLNRVLIGGLIAVALIVLPALVAFSVALRAFTMPAESMEPTLRQGDYFFALRPPFFGAPRRGDLVVFKLPSSGHVDFIERLVGMPGERVQLKAGVVYINDKPLPETALGDGQGDLPGGRQSVLLFRERTPEGRAYTIQRAPGQEPAGDTGVYVLLPHCYFALGDNRDDTLDSRFDPGVDPSDPKLGGCGWDNKLDESVGDQPGVGFVPEANLVGRVLGHDAHG